MNFHFYGAHFKIGFVSLTGSLFFFLSLAMAIRLKCSRRNGREGSIYLWQHRDPRERRGAWCVSWGIFSSLAAGAAAPVLLVGAPLTCKWYGTNREKGRPWSQRTSRNRCKVETAVKWRNESSSLASRCRSTLFLASKVLFLDFNANKTSLFQLKANRLENNQWRIFRCC